MAKALGPHLSTFQITFVRYGGAVVWLTAYVALTRGAWPDAARDALTHLRAHPDLRVRHAARQVFTAPEAPVLAL